MGRPNLLMRGRAPLFVVDGVPILAGIDISPKVRFESNINYNRQYTDNVPDVGYGPNSLIYIMAIWGRSD